MEKNKVIYTNENRPTIKIYDLAIESEIVRSMNDDEWNDYQSLQLKSETRKAEEEAKAQAKATAEGKLAALGLTTDDLRALGLQHNLEEVCNGWQELLS